VHDENIRAKTVRSLERYQRAQHALAGGVSSGLRRSARPYPLYFTHGEGSTVFDVDGNRYIDYGLAWGPLIVGHAHPEIRSALNSVIDRGLTFGAQHDLEFEVAEKLVSAIPCAAKVCFANSGTEIVQLALRLARAATGRGKHLKFEGHYHGWDDSVLVSYRPSADEIASYDGSPVPVAMGQRPHDSVFVAEWNAPAQVEAIFSSHGAEIAAVICEPFLANGGCIPPDPGFLEFLREITSRNGTVLIFDEVITGFRLALGGAQSYYNVTPDLATYAKAIGGGAPLSALGGKKEFMDLIADGRVVHAGTLNGNLLALAAANATLDILTRDHRSIYAGLWRLGEQLRVGMQTILKEKGHKVVTSGGGPVFQLSFMDRPARTWRGQLAADQQRYAALSLALLDLGVLALPDGRWYVSAVHTAADVENTLEAVRRAQL